MLIAAADIHYLDVLRRIHARTFARYLEIGSRSGRSLALSQSPSIAVDPFFDLRQEVMGEKPSLHLYQCESDDFFCKNLALLSETKVDLGFIDGMHLFEYAIRDLMNISFHAAESSLVLIHDVMPVTYLSATRSYSQIKPGAPWVGDVWKLVPILSEFLARQDILLVPCKPTGLLAVFSPSVELARQLQSSSSRLVSEWMEVELESFGPEKVYGAATVVSVEEFFGRLDEAGIGDCAAGVPRSWVSH